MKNMTLKSPYEKTYKYHVTTCERNLINRRQVVTKLDRKELEDKYLTLCDENYFLKCSNTKKDEKIKLLLAKIIRINETKSNLRASSVSVLSDMRMILRTPSEFDDNNSGLEIKAINLNQKKRQKSVRNGSIKESKENISTDLDEVPIPSHTTLPPTGHSMKTNLNNFSNQIEELKQTLSIQLAENSKLNERNEYLEQQLSQINLKKYIMENSEVNRYKAKVIELRQALQKLQDKLIKLSNQKNTKIIIQQKEITELMSQLKDLKEKNVELNEKTNYTKTYQRQIEILKQEIDELKYDKKSLMEQQDNLAHIIKTAALHQDTITTTTSSINDTGSECCDCDSIINGSGVGHDHEDLKDNLIKLKTENAAIRRSQDEMFKKLCHLQDLNDEVTIELERYRPNFVKFQDI